MSTILTILHILVCVFLMLTVLLQAGKGGGMGAAFGGGSSSGTVFGGSGAGNFLKKLTVGAAIVFVFTSMSLAYLASTSGSDPLKRLSAQERRNAELSKERHQQATGAEATGAEGTDAPDEVAPGDDAPPVPGDDAPPVPGAEGADLPDTAVEGAEAVDGAAPANEVPPAEPPAEQPRRERVRRAPTPAVESNESAPVEGGAPVEAEPATP